MKKIWSYIAMFFSGAFFAMLIAYLTKKTQVENNEIEIKKVKMKKSPNGLQDLTQVLDLPEMKNKTKTRLKQELKDLRKYNRKQKLNLFKKKNENN